MLGASWEPPGSAGRGEELLGAAGERCCWALLDEGEGRRGACTEISCTKAWRGEGRRAARSPQSSIFKHLPNRLEEDVGRNVLFQFCRVCLKILTALIKLYEGYSF